MTTWNPRQLPYPLLAPWTEDYAGTIFNTTVPTAVLNDGKQISFTIKYHVTSTYLSGLIASKKAEYITVLVCPSTGVRCALSTFDDEGVHVLEAGDYTKQIQLFSYIVAKQTLRSFGTPEHAEEFRTYRPDGFEISAGSILGVADEVKIELEEGTSADSIIDLVQDNNIPPGEFRVNLDDVRIKIHVHPKEKVQIEALRARGRASTEMVSLFPALYLHAITEALRNLGESNSQWTDAMREALRKKGIDADDEVLRDNAVPYAQQLLDRPLGVLLTALANREEE